jgi:hypothetical protein
MRGFLRRGYFSAQGYISKVKGTSDTGFPRKVQERDTVITEKYKKGAACKTSVA